MPQNNTKYSFFDSQSQTIIENLTWVQAHALCRCLLNKGYQSYYIHLSTEPKWVPLMLVINDIISSKDTLMRTIPVPTDKIDDKIVANHQLISAHTDRRQYPRIEKQLEVVFDVGGLLKKANTVDVSVGGIKIDTSIEISQNTKFIMAYIKYKNMNLEFKVQPLSNGYSFDKGAIVSCSNFPAWNALVEE
jgi:hypothetical protein